MRRVLFLFGLISAIVGAVFVAQVAAQDGEIEVAESNCLTCHTDEGLLQELAEEKVVVKAANEGSG